MLRRSELEQLLGDTHPGNRKKLESGAVLFGHIPDVAPHAYLHSLFAPLSDELIADLQIAIGRDIPPGYRQLLCVTNGAKVFLSSIALLGKRGGYSRGVDAASEPYSIVNANTRERPRQLPREFCVIGALGDDGSILAMSSELEGLSWFTRDGGKLNGRWPSLESFLREEIDRLSHVLGPTYVDLRSDSTVSTLPPVRRNR